MHPQRQLKDSRNRAIWKVTSGYSKMSLLFWAPVTALSTQLNWNGFKAIEVLSYNSSSRLPDGPEDEFANLSGRIHSGLRARSIN